MRRRLMAFAVALVLGASAAAQDYVVQIGATGSDADKQEALRKAVRQGVLEPALEAAGGVGLLDAAQTEALEGELAGTLGAVEWEPRDKANPQGKHRLRAKPDRKKAQELVARALEKAGLGLGPVRIKVGVGAVGFAGGDDLTTAARAALTEALQQAGAEVVPFGTAPVASTVTIVVEARVRYAPFTGADSPQAQLYAGWLSVEVASARLTRGDGKALGEVLLLSKKSIRDEDAASPRAMHEPWLGKQDAPANVAVRYAKALGRNFAPAIAQKIRDGKRS